MNSFSESEGTPSEAGVQKDAIVHNKTTNLNLKFVFLKAMLKFAFNHPEINPETIFAHGRSLGGPNKIINLFKYIFLRSCCSLWCCLWKISSKIKEIILY